jgi:hypothetical protein
MVRAGGGLVLLLAVVGCSGSTGQVSGVVKVGDKPIDKGTITFTPVDGKGQPGFSRITDGKYSARAPVGKAKVSVTWEKVVGKKPLYEGGKGPERVITENGVPDRYTGDKTTLEYDVKPGSQDKSFDLESK